MHFPARFLGFVIVVGESPVENESLDTTRDSKSDLIFDSLIGSIHSSHGVLMSPLLEQQRNHSSFGLSFNLDKLIALRIPPLSFT